MQSEKMTDSRNLRNSLRENLRELPNETRRIIDDAQERVSDFVDVSKDYLRENQAIALAGASLLMGVVGFFIGRATSKSED